MEEDVNKKNSHTLEFFFVCILCVILTLLGYYSWSQKKQKPSSDPLSPEALMAAMMQTKGVIESQSIVLLVNENGQVEDTKHQIISTDEQLSQILLKALDSTNQLQIEGSETTNLEKVFSVFKVAKELGFQTLKYQIIPKAAQDQNPSKEDVKPSKGK